MSPELGEVVGVAAVVDQLPVNWTPRLDIMVRLHLYTCVGVAMCIRAYVPCFYFSDTHEKPQKERTGNFWETVQVYSLIRAASTISEDVVFVVFICTCSKWIRSLQMSLKMYLYKYSTK